MKNILCTLRLKSWEFHAKPDFAFNDFGGNLYCDALILEVFQVCLVIVQRRFTLKGVFQGVEGDVGS